MILSIIKGIFIGAGAILPGISSGVLCVVFGLYEKLLNAVLGFFTNVKENIKFLFPIMIGIFCGVFLFGNILNYLLNNFKVPTYFCFTGLILGSIPSIVKETKVKKIKLHHVLALILTLSFSLYLVAVENYITSYELTNTSFTSFVLSGFAMSAGVVVPGVSSTVILMLFGKYEMYLSAISTINLSILIPMGLGLLLGSAIILYIIKFLLAYFKSITYFAIIGFALGSIFVLIPNISSIVELIYGLIFLVIGLMLAIGCQKSEVRSRRSEVGGRKSEN